MLVPTFAVKDVERLFTKGEVNRAGEFFRGKNTVSEDTAYEILDNWRAVHSYPMQVFYVRLKETSKDLDDYALVAQRLKRASSIIAKLTRRYDDNEPTMELSQMQDIGGCRAILSNVKLAKRLSEEKNGLFKYNTLAKAMMLMSADCSALSFRALSMHGFKIGFTARIEPCFV